MVYVSDGLSMSGWIGDGDVMHQSRRFRSPPQYHQHHQPTKEEQEIARGMGLILFFVVISQVRAGVTPVILEAGVWNLHEIAPACDCGLWHVKFT